MLENFEKLQGQEKSDRKGIVIIRGKRVHEVTKIRGKRSISECLAFQDLFQQQLVSLGAPL